MKASLQLALESSRRFAPVGLVVLLGALLSSCTAPTEPDRGCAECNVVLVSLDTLRPDHLGLYGYHRDTSPHLERLARDGVVFDTVVSNGGRTLPVHMSMMTSLPPSVHNVLSMNERALEPERTTLAEQLREAGLQTIAYTDGGWMSRKFGFDQGFDEFHDSGGGFEANLPEAMEWLDSHADAPFFMFLHSYDVHSRPAPRPGTEFGQRTSELPYSCPGWDDHYFPEYAGNFDGCDDGRCATDLLKWYDERLHTDPSFDLGESLDEQDLRYIVSLYDGCINYVDAQVGSLVDKLRQSGMYDETLIVVTSDHGEEFLDHGRLLHLNGHYEEMVRVPLVVKFPGGRWAGRRVTEGLIATTDIMPTILEELDVPIHSDAMGESFLPLVAEGRRSRTGVHFFNSLRTDRWKLLRHQGEEYLFDLASDPDEKVDLSGEHPGRVREMKQAAMELMQRDEELFSGFRMVVEAQREGVDLSPEEIEKLRALGYVR